MRCFIAFDLPAPIKEELSQAQDSFKDCNLDAKWVKPQNIHMTLKFLGDVAEEKLDKIKEVITQVAQANMSLEADLTDFGFFPNQRKPRVFFISTNKEAQLKAIARSLENKLEPLGFEKEEKFKSHLTLARIKSSKNIEALLEKLEQIKIDSTISIKKITLFKSTLSSEGPTYEKIFSANLTICKMASE
jgi:RNA 2',3'-cyclic 3'-phosphodiesterase